MYSQVNFKSVLRLYTATLLVYYKSIISVTFLHEFSKVSVRNTRKHNTENTKEGRHGETDMPNKIRNKLKIETVRPLVTDHVTNTASL